MSTSEFVERARASEGAHGPVEAHARAELRERLRHHRNHLTMLDLCAAAELTEAEVRALLDPLVTCGLTTEALRATVRRVSIAAGYSEA